MLSLYSLTAVQAAELLTKEETVTFLGQKISLVKTVDNFIVLFDSSSSMAEPYKNTGMQKIEAAKKILIERNKLVPGFDWQAGLYTYTPPVGWRFSSAKAFQPFYEMQPYNQDEFGKAIEQLPSKASGPTLLNTALDNLDSLLAGLSGRTVVFLFTDGSFSSKANDIKPVVQARKMAKKHDVSFYVISSAKGEKEKKILEAVASINEYSRVISFDALLNTPELFMGAFFVIDREFFLAYGTRQKTVGLNVENILFDYNRSEIGGEFPYELNTLGRFLQNNPKAYVILSGFTDSTGSQEYNLGLSRRRAESVSSYLTEKYAVNQERIVQQWYGKLSPTASNDTEEGRQLNRRVVCIVTGLE